MVGTSVPTCVTMSWSRAWSSATAWARPPGAGRSCRPVLGGSTVCCPRAPRLPDQRFQPKVPSTLLLDTTNRAAPLERRRLAMARAVSAALWARETCMYVAEVVTLPLLERAMATDSEPKRIRNIIASTAATPRRDLTARRAVRARERAGSGRRVQGCALGSGLFTSSPPGHAWGNTGRLRGDDPRQARHLVGLGARGLLVENGDRDPQRELVDREEGQLRRGGLLVGVVAHGVVVVDVHLLDGDPLGPPLHGHGVVPVHLDGAVGTDLRHHVPEGVDRAGERAAQAEGDAVQVVQVVDVVDGELVALAPPPLKDLRGAAADDDQPGH